MILVFGRTGQVAKELQKILPAAVYLDRSSADLNDPAICRKAVLHHKPSAVINAAAWTDVDGAETAEAQATIINAEAPRSMAQACHTLSIPFIHISTDYVFSGTGSEPWSETAPANPQTAYGRSKYLGEQWIAQTGAHFTILRTSWVFSAHSKNFVRTILRVAKGRASLNVVDDQYGGPTAANDIAAAIATIVDVMQRGEAGGTFHFAGGPDTHWAALARQIVARAGIATSITGIASSDYPTAANRPKNSRLDCSKIGEQFGIGRPNWSNSLDGVLKELGEHP